MDGMPTNEGVAAAREALRAGRLETVAYLLGEDTADIAALGTEQHTINDDTEHTR